MPQASVDLSVRQPSERLLSEVARHVVIPEGIVDSVWFDLEDRFAEWDIGWDAWQDGFGQIMLGVRDDGKYAATVGGVTVSIVRQVAKTYIVSRTIFGLCTLFPESTWLWTAHRTRTMTQTFQKLAGFTQRKSVKPYLKANRNDGIRATNGEQEIRFRNDSVILFGARENGFGRGFDEVDGEVFDEAQILSERALEDMVPASNQSRNPHGALLIYMGTPPRPEIDPGEVIKARRRRALEGKPADQVVWVHGNAVYVETSADPNVGKPGGPSLMDPVQIAKANPSYPHRTPQESIDRMRENLPSDDSWLREGLGVWDDDQEGSRAISVADWEATGTRVAPDGVRSFGVAFSMDGSRAALAGAVKHPNGIHVEVIDAMSGDLEAGVDSLASWLSGRWRECALIAISGQAWSAALTQKLLDQGVPRSVVHVLSGPEVYASSALFLDAVLESARVVRAKELPSLTHPVGLPTDHLERSVAVADRRVRIKTSGAWAWAATTADGDETPVEAVSFANWAARTTKRDPSRKQVIL